MRTTGSWIKTDFDFGWKRYKSAPPVVELTLQYQKGDIVDVGCGTCELSRFLRSRGWKGEYYGIDLRKYESYEYPENVNLIVGDALHVRFPEADTVVAYNILEHLDEPEVLLNKAIRSCRHNVLINVPKRNEEMWARGLVEYHQLDKTHKHCGFSRTEVRKLVEVSGGKIRSYKELGRIDGTVGIGLWNNKIPRVVVIVLSKIFSSATFYQEIWCEVVRRTSQGQ